MHISHTKIAGHDNSTQIISKKKSPWPTDLFSILIFPPSMGTSE